MRSFAPALLAIAALLAGCGSSALPPTSVGNGAPEAPRSAPGAVSQAGGSTPDAPVAASDRAIILTGNVSLYAADPWGVADRVQAIATGLGGDVLSASQSGASDSRSATVRFRVPAERFNEALKQVRALGAEVVSSGVTSQDVTDQYVDLQARLASKQAEERTYVALLAQAKTVEEILKIDQALGTVRTDIERLQAQVNAMKSKITYSTIVVSIEMAPFGPNRGVGWNPGRTITDAWNAMLALAQGVGDLVIWVVVVGWLPLAVLGGAVTLARRLRRRAALRLPPAGGGKS